MCREVIESRRRTRGARLGTMIGEKALGAYICYISYWNIVSKPNANCYAGVP